MITTVYLVRHSEPFKIHKGIEKTSENIYLNNIKSPLSVNGEYLADEFSSKEEFINLDIIWSSNYVRAISTAKYFAYKNNLKVNIDESLGERKHGVNSWDDLPIDFEKKQFLDENFKIGTGESKKEVQERLYFTFMNILRENVGKRILIVGHATATAFLLDKWCEVNYDEPYKFNSKEFFDGKWNYCQTFKLEFLDMNLINIEIVR